MNYLKYTNDSQGHAAGDVLLRKSAQCISDCFGAPEEKNCFRFGGDEFAAVVKDVDPGTVAQLVEAFLAEQQRRGISVSCGYAYTEDIGSTTIRTLMDMADERMYEQKKQVHELPGGAENYGAPEDGE